MTLAPAATRFVVRKDRIFDASFHQMPAINSRFLMLPVWDAEESDRVSQTICKKEEWSRFFTIMPFTLPSPDLLRGRQQTIKLRAVRFRSGRVCLVSFSGNAGEVASEIKEGFNHMRCDKISKPGEASQLVDPSRSLRMRRDKCDLGNAL